ncbi:MAG: Shikimate 5-dehydrogenase alpha [Myxococcaceae bacterium]|nr:Shikimate 5-dehydrogenase alpha [Myxococcaceae bacterium]
MELFSAIDPRLARSLQSEWERGRTRAHEPLPRGVTLALVGHRAAGKSSLLPEIARLLGREGVDLDAEVARRSGRPLHEWVTLDPSGFRLAERTCFESLPRGSLVACGGGFLSAHPDALRGCLAVLVPITLETYCERLRSDTSRPRLIPELPFEQELREVWFEREEKHRRVHTVPLVDFLLSAAAGKRPRRVVTLPPAVNPRDFAFRALHGGAELLEVRTDLIPPEADLAPAARVLPLLIAERGQPVPEAWRRLAELMDGESPWVGNRGLELMSHHAPAPMTPDEAEAHWSEVPRGTLVKHVEPLGPVSEGWRLLETQARLQARFGEDAVTVLTTGPLALPFRAVLARKNALDYLALDPTWSAAGGQRLLADAVREARAGLPSRPRLAVLGHQIALSRSPSIHPQPFDRIELPPDVEVAPFVTALLPHYRGFAVTSPFKRHVLPTAAVNTLWRSGSAFEGDNTDVVGASAALSKLGGSSFTVLGQGGVADALAAAAVQLGVELRFVQRGEAAGKQLTGAIVWTWPSELEAPEGLSLQGARVGVISYGARGHRIARQIRALGGTPVWLGARWFVKQARAQRERWEAAR